MTITGEEVPRMALRVKRPNSPHCEEEREHRTREPLPVAPPDGVKGSDVQGRSDRFGTESVLHWKMIP